jgi:hypothetical protein
MSMVETIAPVVHGGRRKSYWGSVLLHSIAATAAAAGVGALLGAVGMGLRAPWGVASFAALASVAALYALRESLRLPIPVPDRHRQVPEWWRTFYSPPVAATLYGLGLGIGFLTYLSFGTYVAVAAAALFFGDPLLGAALCAPFGLARGLSVVAWSLGTSSPNDSLVRIENLSNTIAPRVVNALALGAIAIAALVSF